MSKTPSTPRSMCHPNARPRPRPAAWRQAAVRACLSRAVSSPAVPLPLRAKGAPASVNSTPPCTMKKKDPLLLYCGIARQAVRSRHTQPAWILYSTTSFATTRWVLSRGV
eukprot:3934642-Rhodomonas_salina.1